MSIDPTEIPPETADRVTITMQVPYERISGGVWLAEADTVDDETLRDLQAAAAEAAETHTRRAWAAAYQQIGEELSRRGLDGGYRVYRDGLLIEDGELTPWRTDAPPAAPASPESAAQPDPSTVAPPDRQGAAEPGIVGRALVVPATCHGTTTTGTLWREAPDGPGAGEWWFAGGYGYATRGEVEAEATEDGHGPVREVLLVDPAVWPVVEAARVWRAQFAPGPDPAKMPRRGALIAAVDALDASASNAQPAETPANLQLEPANESADPPDIPALVAIPDLTSRERAAYLAAAAELDGKPAGLDLDAIEGEHLRQCGPCDFGLVEMACNCSTGDPRVAISRLVAEVRRLRAAHHTAMADLAAEQQATTAAVTRAEAAERDAEQARAELDEAHTDLERVSLELDRLANTGPSLATARRADAADALDWAAGEVTDPCAADLTEWAAAVRSGTRTIPTTTEETDRDDH